MQEEVNEALAKEKEEDGLRRREEHEDKLRFQKLEEENIQRDFRAGEEEEKRKRLLEVRKISILAKICLLEV